LKRVSIKAARPFEEKRWTISQSVDFPLTTIYRLKAVREEEKHCGFASAPLRMRSPLSKTRYIEVLYALHLQELGKQQKDLSDELYKAVYHQIREPNGQRNRSDKCRTTVAEAENVQDEAERLLHTAATVYFT
jgi:cobalt-zinc-cadmium efflux system outer membrane protein